jgi:hypothetical protein
MNKLTFLLCLLTFMARTPSVAQSPGGALAKALIGEWRNLYVKINLKDKVMEADSSNWEARLHIKPIRTHFRDDGTYYSEYRNLQDSVVRMPSGTWSVEGDSLTMTELKPDKSTMKFQLHIDRDIATFTGLIDFDGDGVANELYYGRQRKFNTERISP